MYAIIRTGGHQYKVAPGDTIDVERFENAQPGAEVELGEVLMVNGDDGVKVGTPLVQGARVTATVIGPSKGEKLIVFKFKAKKRERRKTGHRQGLTRVRIKGISL